MDEFRELPPKLVQAAIARAAEIEQREGGGWTLNRRRALVAGLLRKRDFRAEVESDTTHADQERARAEAQREREARAAAKRDTAQRIAVEQAQRERDAAAEQLRAECAEIDAATDSAITEAIETVTTDVTVRRAILALRARGIADREIARSIRFRAAVTERLRALHNADATAAAGAP